MTATLTKENIVERLKNLCPESREMLHHLKTNYGTEVAVQYASRMLGQGSEAIAPPTTVRNYEWGTATRNVRNAIQSAGENPITTKEIQQQLGCCRRSVTSAIERLCGRGEIYSVRLSRELRAVGWLMSDVVYEQQPKRYLVHDVTYNIAKDVILPLLETQTESIGTNEIKTLIEFHYSITVLRDCLKRMADEKLIICHKDDQGQQRFHWALPGIPASAPRFAPIAHKNRVRRIERWAAFEKAALWCLERGEAKTSQIRKSVKNSADIHYQMHTVRIVLRDMESKGLIQSRAFNNCLIWSLKK